MKYQIMQMKNPNFLRYKYLTEKGGFDINNYTLVYEGETDEIDGCEDYVALDYIFTLFNIKHPTDFKGHSLSVGDVVILNGTMWYCDSYDWVNVGEYENAK